MKIKKLITISILSLIPALASADGGIAAIGYADRDSIKGAEVELGYRKTFDNVGINILPLTGIWHNKSNSKYREETFNNGTTICRDTTNGHFSKKDECNNKSFSYAFIASTDYSISDAVAVGAGIRIGDKTDPFVTLRIMLGKNMSLQAKVGGKYNSAGLAFGF